MSRIVSLLLAVACSSVCFGAIDKDRDWVVPGVNVVPNQIVIQIIPAAAPLKITSQPGLPLTDIPSLDAVASSFGVEKIEKEFIMKSTPSDPKAVDLSRYYRVTFSDKYDPTDVGIAYEKCKEVEFAEHLRLHKKLYLPNDPRRGSEWHIAKIGCPAAWDLTHGSKSITIGVIDGGMDMPTNDIGEIDIHEDIAQNIWINPGEDIDHDGAITPEDWNGLDDDGDGYADDFWGWNITGGENVPNDPYAPGGIGHGTHVAGCASAATDNGIGVSGVGFNTSVMPIACWSRQGDDFVQNDDRGFEYAGNAHANIVNCSFGSIGAPSRAESDAVTFARQHGVIVFAAMGNDTAYDRRQNPRHHYPACYDGVIAVAASDENDNATVFTSYGDYVDLVSPGQGILSTLPHNRYGAYDGTSDRKSTRLNSSHSDRSRMPSSA